MTLANKISVVRILSSPLLYLLFYAGWVFGETVAALATLILFLLIEFSDLLDGYIARKMKQVSNLGKLLDPFADVILHVILFTILVETKIMPGWAFLIFILRELGAILIRMILIGQGTALAAGRLGKLKSFSYAVAAFVGLIAAYGQRFLLADYYQNIVQLVFMIILGIGLLLSAISFATYFVGFLKLKHR